jgi:bifunctional DNase/RNase
MKNPICHNSDCRKPVTVHIIRVRERSLVEESHYCQDHGRAAFADYRSRVRASAQDFGLSGKHTILFDITALLFTDAARGPWQIYLEETNGARGLGINSGPFECSALIRKFKHCNMPRPTTHDAMVATMMALGGRLQHIVIDKFLVSQKVFEAKLHIQQSNATVVVDVRPSDAVILAVICAVPIFVSNDVLWHVSPPEEDDKGVSWPSR